MRLQAMLPLVGDVTAGVLRETTITKGFPGARGLSLERGLMDLNPRRCGSRTPWRGRASG